MKPAKLPKVKGVAGKWILMVGDRTIRESDSPGVLFDEALKYPPDQVVVTKVLSAGASFY